MKGDHLLLYDADCGFCRWTTDKILARDRDHRIRAVPLQSAEADTLLPGMDRDKKMASWHLVTPDGTVHSAGAGVAPLMELLPKGKPVAAAARVSPALTGAAYRLIAANRTRFGRLLGAQKCAVDPSTRTKTRR
jgi:predicted DCC family thiol-disulfide oxidoreductase YuxK